MNQFENLTNYQPWHYNHQATPLKDKKSINNQSYANLWAELCIIKVCQMIEHTDTYLLGWG